MKLPRPFVIGLASAGWQRRVGRAQRRGNKTSTPSAPKFEQGIPYLIPALKLFKGFSFSVRRRARSVLLSGAQLQSSTQLLSTSREHWLDERKVLRQRSCPDVLPQFALHRRHLRPFRHYVVKLPAGIGN